jgi:hypothetical protein
VPNQPNPMEGNITSQGKAFVHKGKTSAVLHCTRLEEALRKQAGISAGASRQFHNGREPRSPGVAFRAGQGSMLRHLGVDSR